MIKFEITPEMMNSTAKEIEQIIEKWNTSVKAIYSLCAELDAQFEGEANVRLNTRMAEEQSKYYEFSEMMTGYTEDLKAFADKVAFFQELETGSCGQLFII